MTLTQGCVLALCRAMAIAGVAVCMAQPLASLLTSQASTQRRRLAWLLLLTPFLTPSLLIGYAYISFATPLVKWPVLHESLYVLLVLMKLTPIAALVVCFAPPPAMTDSAVHCRRLLCTARPRPWSRLAALWPFWIRGRGRIAIAAFGVVFLLAFGEFEIASLLELRIGLRQNIGTWTVWIYDLQTGGTPLATTLRYALVPAACELLVIGLVLVLLLNRRNKAPGLPIDPARQSRLRRRLAWCYLVVAVVIVSIVPAASVLRWGVQSWQVVALNPDTYAEIGNSLLFGAAGAVVAYLIAWRLLAMTRVGLTIAACLPGLLGSLVLGLTVLAVFQLSPLNRAYDTPLPLVVALSVLLLPVAIVLMLVLRPGKRGSSDHIVDMLGVTCAQPMASAARRLAWETRGRLRFWIVFVVFYFGYLDLSATALLAPTSMPVVTVRMYNQMHFGRTDALSALLCAAVAAPVIFLLISAGIGRLAGAGFRKGLRQA